MNRLCRRIALIGAVIVATAIGYATPAAAQATRTWVSGVGDDVNPCSRTAPCKTFAGAISKTAPGGEINCLDPGGFGAVTITKSMTISCPYTEGGALAGGNGIVVNAQPTDVVFIRGLDIFGVNPPTNGIRFIAGGALHVEDTVIRRFNASNSVGISFQPGGNSVLNLNNVTIADNGSLNTGGGILIKPTGAGSASVMIHNSRMYNNANLALSIDTTGNTGTGIKVAVDDSQFSGSGIRVLVPNGTTTAVVMITNSLIAAPGATGIIADGSNARVRVGNTTITNNATGVSILNSAIVNTYLDNILDGNNVDGAFTAPSIPRK